MNKFQSMEIEKKNKILKYSKTGGELERIRLNFFNILGVGRCIYLGFYYFMCCHILPPIRISVQSMCIKSLYLYCVIER